MVDIGCVLPNFLNTDGRFFHHVPLLGGYEMMIDGMTVAGK